MKIKSCHSIYNFILRNMQIEKKRTKKNIAVSVSIRVGIKAPVQLITLTREIGSKLKLCPLKNSSWKLSVECAYSCERAHTNRATEIWKLIEVQKDEYNKVVRCVFHIYINLKWHFEMGSSNKSHSIRWHRQSLVNRHQIKLLFTCELKNLTHAQWTCLHFAKFSNNVSRFLAFMGP